MKIAILAFTVGLSIGLAVGVQHEVVGIRIGLCEDFCTLEIDVDGCVGISDCLNHPNHKLDVYWGESDEFLRRVLNNPKTEGGE